MSLRFTEEQLLAHLQRLSRGKKPRAAPVARPRDYDLQQHVVRALELGTRHRPSSPLIVTLNLGLKTLLKDNGTSTPYERIEQAIALLWLECTAPEAFAVTTANPMGGYRPYGAGGQIRGEGAKLGYPDLLMDRAMHGYHGLRIEMKKYCPSANPSDDQHDWLTRLSGEGFRAVLCRGHQSAIHVFAEYLGLITPVFENNLPEWAIQYY